jgi:hypothetical protein
LNYKKKKKHEIALSLTSSLLEGSQSSEEGSAGHVGHFGLGGRFGRLFHRDAFYWRSSCIYKKNRKFKI